ncbi:GLE1-domain-containing protein [Piedraia hortae CBS 480.64]|uniref:mRNA export factor GLE1 n=1 Tax=Piedraia hortae CBS 480.64 TaxID=1314780 RepID=A0A6A7BYD7_9PEZI|nr:GLE1-domain-containing protein [Piedraia hortae CBS 480.64]
MQVLSGSSSSGAPPNKISSSSSASHPVNSDGTTQLIVKDLELLYTNGESTFRRNLDARTEAQRVVHNNAIQNAWHHHEAVRSSAQHVRELTELQEARQRLAREKEEERKRDDEKRRLDEEARERREEFERRRAQEKSEMEALRQMQREQSNSLEPQRPQLQQGSGPAPPSNSPQPVNSQPSAPSGVATSDSAPQNPLVCSLAELERVHNRYLELWKQLKMMRREVCQRAKQNNQWDQLAEWRRSFRRAIGQLNKAVPKENTKRLSEMRKVLNEAAAVPQPSLDISKYLVFSHHRPAKDLTGLNTDYPEMLFFLLNCISKFAIAQLLSEASSDSATGEPIGILLCNIFSVPEYQWQGESVIDIVWAKFHAVCPALFGIWGREATRQGRDRIGWWVVDRNDPEAAARVSSETHYQRMAGLGVGFASITLRDFSKSRNRNPAPNTLWWEAVARIVNLKKGEAQTTHYVLLKAMIDEHLPRVLGIFGGAGLVALRNAIIEFPKKGPMSKDGKTPVPAVMAVEGLRLMLRQKYGVTL